MIAMQSLRYLARPSSFHQGTNRFKKGSERGGGDGIRGVSGQYIVVVTRIISRLD